MSQHPSITDLLHAWRGGDAEAREQLIPIVFNDLRAIARRQLELEPPGHTLQPTAVVHELYLKLIEQRQVRWESRRDFFAVSAGLIRRILVDHARRRAASKRQVWACRVPFEDDLDLPPSTKSPTLVELDDALKDLARVDPRGARVVELHFFGGLTFDEIAQVLDIARSTVLRDWRHARLWLSRQLRHDERGGGGRRSGCDRQAEN